MRILKALLLVASGFIIAGLVMSSTGRNAPGPRADATPAAAAAPEPAPAPVAARDAALEPSAPPGPAVTIGPDFTRVAAQAVRGVANISSLQVVRTRTSPFFSDPFFREFFGDFYGDRDFDRRSLSLGSGVVVSPDGYVVTNDHVVGTNVREITVALADKREVRGRLVGTDPATDLALVKVDVANLPVVPWGDSNTLQVGEWVLAIGSPFQLSSTVTAGIVSATGRTNVGFADYEDFIQTDAAINPGNSGGALVNKSGELVGINTGIFSQSGGYQGIGFAVPSNLARHVIDDLRKYGEVRRGAIDFQVQPLTAEVADQLGLQSTRGALVWQMHRRSASWNAGLRPGDIIVEFNGQPVGDASQLKRYFYDGTIGTTATLKVLREGRTLEIDVPVESSASASQARRRR
jgi:Do/DeqQ family serine protease